MGQIAKQRKMNNVYDIVIEDSEIDMDFIDFNFLNKLKARAYDGIKELERLEKRLENLRNEEKG